MRNIKNIYHLCVALLFQFVYGFPARKLKVIGITGTDGKTTTSSLIFHILKTAGKKVSALTTVSAHIGGVDYDTGFHVTTPAPQDVVKYLRDSVNHGDEYFVFEITSHGLDQNRAAGVGFEVSGITNITHEHLGYHGSFERYVEAKSRILTASKLTFLNADQPEIVNMIRTKCPGTQTKTFGLEQKADVSDDIEKKFLLTLEPYNRSNFLLAYAIARHLGISDADFGRAVATYKFPPGRMEVIYDAKFTVISDFAHTPNAIEQALIALRQRYPNRKIIHVFGAAAHRDDAKRPAMGKASALYAATTILTEEDYRDEEPERIFAMLGEGLQSKGSRKVDAGSYAALDKTYTCIVNREEAICKAISLASPGDVVVVTGKAHEKSLCRGTVEYPYDEKKTIVDAVKKI